MLKGSTKMGTCAEKFPERIGQVEEIVRHLGSPGDKVPNLFAFGHSPLEIGTIVRDVLDSMKEPFAFINCVHCHTQRHLFEKVINDLTGHDPLPENDYENHTKCDKTDDFVWMLAELAKEQRVFLVFQHAERLRAYKPALLPVLLRIDALTNCSVSCIFISDITWDHFRVDNIYTEPVAVHFPEYSKENLAAILLREAPQEANTTMYSAWITIMINVLFDACRDFSEFKHLTVLLYPKYAAPVTRGEVEPTETGRLNAMIMLTLKKILDKLYLREMSSSEWAELLENDVNLDRYIPRSGRLEMEIPYYTKFLLIASYLASYNPQKTDLKMFSSVRTGRSRAGISKSQAKQVHPQRLIGPRPFVLARMLAIFYSILGEHPSNSAAILTQVSSLVTLGLLTSVSAPGVIDEPKYRCNVSHETIKQIAANVRCELHKFVHE